MNVDWQKFEKIKAHPSVKNQKVLAVYITKDNADAVSDETGVFVKYNDNCVLTGFMAFQRLPVWMVMINPKGKKKKFVFEYDRAFEQYFELLKEAEQ